MFDASGVRMVTTLIVALLILPLIFITLGFIAASTLLFSIVAIALRGTRPSARSIVIDLAVGAAFAIVLFLMFTRGLSVSLPGPALF